MRIVLNGGIWGEGGKREGSKISYEFGSRFFLKYFISDMYLELLAYSTRIGDE